MFALNFNKITMQIFNKNIELREFLASEKSKTSTIGFVPTMGALHDGHLALISQSLQENNSTVVSIFVNPTQFNNPDDLLKYPRTLESDLELLAKSECDIVFAPSNEEIYPLDLPKISLDLGTLNGVMEDALRPGHFNGVVNVVYRLFDIVKPSKAFFGLKDFQQVAKGAKLTVNPSVKVKAMDEIFGSIGNQ